MFPTASTLLKMEIYLNNRPILNNQLFFLLTKDLMMFQQNFLLDKDRHILIETVDIENQLSNTEYDISNNCVAKSEYNSTVTSYRNFHLFTSVYNLNIKKNKLIESLNNEFNRFTKDEKRIIILFFNCVILRNMIIKKLRHLKSSAINQMIPLLNSFMPNLADCLKLTDGSEEGGWKTSRRLLSSFINDYHKTLDIYSLFTFLYTNKDITHSEMVLSLVFDLFVNCV